MIVLRNLMAAASLLLIASPAAAVSPGIGEVVSDTTFTTAYGQSLKMGDLRGQVVVLTFWTDDCAPCVEQLKVLDFYYRQRRNVGLQVLAVAAEDMTDRQLKYAFKDKLIHPIARMEGPFEPTEALPTTFVIDRNGQVRHVVTEGLDIDKLNRILVPLLRQPQP